MSATHAEITGQPPKGHGAGEQLRGFAALLHGRGSAGKEFAGSLTRLSVLAAGIGIAAAVLYVIQFPTFREAVSVLGAAGAVGAAAAAAGCLVGFLFGIPRSLQSADQQGDGGDGYANNTNLEQISDWLTKILVGIGLVQIASAPDALGSLAEMLAPAFGGVATSATFALSLSLYFSITGLIIAYLWTRGRLKSIFAETDRELVTEIATKQAQRVASEKAAEIAEDVATRQASRIEDTAEARAEQVARSMAEDIARAHQAAADDNAFAQVLVDRQLSGSSPPTLEELTSAIEKATPDWRVTFYHRAEQLRSQAWQRDKAAMDRVIPVFRALIATDQDQKYFRHHGSLGYALKDREPPDHAGAVEALSTAIRLRDAQGRSGSPFLEWSRAYCLIRLDPDFAAQRPSGETSRAAVVADLTVAVRTLSDRFFEQGKDPGATVVAAWLALQPLTLVDLRGDG